jgi:hypothetical protein
VYFGGIPVDSERGDPGVRYEAISIETINQLGTVKYELQRSISDFYPKSQSFQSKQLSTIEINQPAGECTLEILVINGKLATVIYQGLTIAELTPDLHRGIVIPTSQPITFGVSNKCGATTFRDLRFMLVGSEGQTR